MPVRQIFARRLEDYDVNRTNTYESVMLQILSFCEEFGLLDLVREMKGMIAD